VLVACSWQAARAGQAGARVQVLLAQLWGSTPASSALRPLPAKASSAVRQLPPKATALPHRTQTKQLVAFASQAEWAHAVSEENGLLRERQLRLEGELRAARASAAAEAAACAAARAGARAVEVAQACSGRGSSERIAGRGNAPGAAAEAEERGRGGVTPEGGPCGAGAAAASAEAAADGAQTAALAPAPGWELADLRDSLAAQSGLTQASARMLQALKRSLRWGTPCQAVRGASLRRGCTHTQPLQGCCQLSAGAALPRCAPPPRRPGMWLLRRSWRGGGGEHAGAHGGAAAAPGGAQGQRTAWQIRVKSRAGDITRRIDAGWQLERCREG